MNQLLLDVWYDLKQKRVWPVAAILGAALLLVPIFLLKGSAPAEEAVATPEAAAPAAVGPGEAPSGPGASPSSSLETMPISLETTPRLAASPLDALKSKNPFERPDAARIDAAVTEIVSGTAAVADETLGTELSSGLGSSGSGVPSPMSSVSGGGGSPGGGSGSGGSPGGGSPGGASSGGGSAGGPSSRSPGSGSDSDPASPGRGKVQLYDYRVDLRVGESAQPKAVHRDVARLTPLPSAERPLLVFLGVSDDGSKAVFLLDTANAQASGGECEPDPKRCTFLTVSKEKGKNEVRLLDAQGKGYDVQVTDIKLERVERGGDGDRRGSDRGSDDERAPAYEPPAAAPPSTDPAEEADGSEGAAELRRRAAVRHRRVGFLFSELFDLVRASR